MTRTTLTALAVVALLLAGCGGEPIASGDAEPQTATATTTVQEPAATATDDPCLEHAYDEEACLAQMNADTGTADERESELDVEVAEGRVDVGPVAEFEANISGASWKDSGVRFKVTRLALLSLENMCVAYDEIDQPAVCYEPEGETVVALDMRVANNSSRDVDYYPDQSQIVLGSEQIDSDVFQSPDGLGGTFREGTKRDGQVWWFSDQSVDDISGLGELRLIVDTPVWTGDWEPITGSYDGGIDLTITW